MNGWLHWAHPEHAPLDDRGQVACWRGCTGHGRHAAVDRASFTQGLLEAADLAHAHDGGALSRFLTTMSGGVELLYLFPPMYS